MNVERTLILLLLLIFGVFMFPEMETAIALVEAENALKPILSAIPYILVGSLFMAFIYLGVMGNNE